MASDHELPPPGKPVIHPQLVGHAMYIFKEEWIAFVSLLRFQWVLALLMVGAIAGMLYLIAPMPPKKIRIATGQPDSSLEVLGRKFQAEFARHGIVLEIVPTAGALENAHLLRRGQVDATFSLGGMVKDEGAGLLSLGSIEYQPVWLFYRGTKIDGIDPNAFLRHRTLSVNLPGSGTRSVSERILALYGIQVEGNPRIASLSSAESIEALQEGRIDGMFLVAGIEATAIKSLLALPQVHVLDMAHADTYRSKMRFLESITLPRGGLDSARDIPPEPKKMVATSTTILTTEALHPALQRLFLITARRIDREGNAFFSRPGGFPVEIEYDLPLSKVAEHYYEKGPPVLHGYFPLWLASFMEEIGFVLVALAAIALPLLRLIPKSRVFYATLCMDHLYYTLRHREQQLRSANTPAQLNRILDQIEQIEQRARHLWVPTGTHDYFYKLRWAIDGVRDETRRRIRQLQGPPVDTGSFGPGAAH